MPFEYPDGRVTATPLFIRTIHGKIKYSGMVRLHFADGTTTIRMTPAIDNSMVFEDIEYIKPTNADETEVGLTNYDSDYGVGIL